MIRNIFFDLDGTLLPMDQDKFIYLYFKALSEKLSPKGYNPDLLIKAVWSSTNKMILNDGTNSNEHVFWEEFKSILGENITKEKDTFDSFYENEFDQTFQACSPNSQANETIKYLKRKNFKLYLATNPIFPSIATRKRIKWTNLDINDFEFVTTYENSNSCKPNLNYYKELLSKFKLKPEETLMIGNDVDEDMIAQDLNIKVFLLTDNLINKHNKDINKYPNGNFNQLKTYIENIK